MIGDIDAMNPGKDDAKLASLRADRAAVQRLWSELDALTKKPPTATP
jgi:hypothetical protein